MLCTYDLNSNHNVVGWSASFERASSMEHLADISEPQVLPNDFFSVYFQFELKKSNFFR